MRPASPIRAVAALTAGLLLAACGLEARPDGALPIEDLDLEPRPGEMAPRPAPVGVPPPQALSPAVDVARGRVAGQAFRVTAYVLADEVCTDVTFQGGGGAGACGGLPGGMLGPTFGTLGWGGGSRRSVEVSGIVAAGVAKVQVETQRGPPARALLLSLAPLDLPARMFLVFLPEGSEPIAVVAFAADGSVLDRFELGTPGEPTPPGA